jgi:hypothetical protein
MKTPQISTILILAVGIICGERVGAAAEEHSTDKPPDPKETISVTARVKDLVPYHPYWIRDLSVANVDFNLAEMTVIEPVKWAGKRMEVLTGTYNDAFARTGALVSFSISGYGPSVYASFYPDRMGVYQSDIVGDIRVIEDGAEDSGSHAADFELTGARVSPTVIACTIRNVSKREIVYTYYGIGYFECVELDYFDDATKKWKRIPRDRTKLWAYTGTGIHRRNIKRIAPGATIPHVRSATFHLPKNLLDKYTFAIPLDKYKMLPGDNLRFRVIQYMGVLDNIERLPVWRGHVVSKSIEVLLNQGLQTNADKPPN